MVALGKFFVLFVTVGSRAQSAEPVCSTSGTCFGKERTSHDSVLLQTSRGSWHWDNRDYDCDGDGVRDCGYFNYGRYHCSNYPKCGHRLKPGDYLMEHSCRCMSCFDQADTAAAKVPMDGAMNGNYYGRWRPWNKLTDTCATWLVPKNDADLQAILRYAKDNQYTVRPAGATHSAGGIVTDWVNNQNVLAVSLAEYTAPSGWEYTFNEESVGKATVVVNAGWSPLQLYEKIRPLNYFLPTQTAGPVFQLGGLVANCVHGGNYRKGFLHQYVVRMRVMLHNGTSRVIEDEADLRFWRNSYGLLGFMTSLEFSLDYRPQFQAYFKTKEVNWNEEDFWTFLKQDAHADLSEETIPAGQPGDRQALMGQFFFNPYEAGETGKATMSAVVWRANENATEPNVAKTAPANVRSEYRQEVGLRTIDEIYSEHPINGKPPVDTYSNYNDAIRHWGGPKVFPRGFDTNDGLAHNSRSMTSLALHGPRLLMLTNRQRMNDGFFATRVPNVVYGAYFLDPKDVWQAFGVLVDSFMERREDPVFMWNGPPELRFLTVTDDAVLNPVPPGVWAVSEYLGFPIGNSDQGWKSAFKGVQDEWEDKLGAKPHIGKFWGFTTTEDGTVQPYQQERACRIFSDAQKSTFETYRRQLDPDGLFAAGDAMKLLSACPSPPAPTPAPPPCLLECQNGGSLDADSCMCTCLGNENHGWTGDDCSETYGKCARGEGSSGTPSAKGRACNGDNWCGGIERSETCADTEVCCNRDEGGLCCPFGSTCNCFAAGWRFCQCVPP